MTSRLSLVAVSFILNEIPGAGPTDEDRRKFHVPSGIEEPSDKDGICLQLSQSAASVFKAAGWTNFQFLIHPPLQDAEEGRHDTDTGYDGGIYLDTPGTNTAIEERVTIKQRRAVGDLLEFGNCLWHHVVVPSFVNAGVADSAFHFQLDDDAPDVADAASESRGHVSPQHYDAPIAPGASSSILDTTRMPATASEDTRSGSSASDDEKVRHPFLRHASKGNEALVHLWKCMRDTFVYQHRTFCYSIYICQKMCRLLKFDHAGAFVSTAFDWTDAGSPLHTFLWKLAQIDNMSHLGYDPTAALASPTEANRFVKMMKSPTVPEEIQQYVQRATSCPIYKLRVTSCPATENERLPDDPTDVVAPEARSTPLPQELETHELLVGRPHFAGHDLIGRCTRGYVALRLGANPDGSEDTLCFLKDCWRSYVPGRTRPEHLVYERLHSSNVKYVATLICGGDVGGPLAQMTQVQAYLFRDNPALRPVPRVHYRLCTKEIGLPLTEFRNFSELSTIFIDALLAHFMAWKYAGVLHRDISIGNIMITPVTRRGFLIDWELSRLAIELESGAVQPDRSGTWQTRSALFKRYPRKPYRLSDDLESFVHAFRYLTLRFHAAKVPDLQYFVYSTYDHVAVVDGLRIGGDTKLSYFWLKRAPFEVIGNPNLQHVLDLLAEGCYTSYADVDHDRAQEVYGISRPTASVPEETGELFYFGPNDWIDDILAQDSDDGDDNDGNRALEPAPVPVPQVEDADPCEIKNGVLARHKRLIDVFQYFKGRPIRKDKGPDLLAQERGRRHIFEFEAVPRNHGSGTVAATSISATSHHETRPALAISDSERPSSATESPRHLHPHISPISCPSMDSAKIATSPPLERSSFKKREREDDVVGPSEAASAGRLEESRRASKRRA